jgi:amidase
MSSRVPRRDFLATSLTAAASAAAASAASWAFPEVLEAAPPPFALAEVGVAELQRRMTRGTTTSRALTQAYLARIAAIDAAGPRLRSVIEVNPEALAIAAARDAERRQGRVRGPLHGIPVLIKDNIDTGDRMQTTAGSLALVGRPAPRDAFLVARLREAGAVLLGKTNLSEWANFRSTRSTSGWSSRGGQVRHPVATDRNPCGSSSGTGSAIAASLAAVGVGTETDGSIICPSSICGLVGLKPTVGLVSRRGIIPISSTQDTAGPMGRTVADVAALLGALAGVDPEDEATAAGAGKALADYTAVLDANALRGARIGVARHLGGFHPAVDAQMDAAVAVLRRLGAEVVDPVTVPNVGRYDEAELTVMLHEFKSGVNAYLASRGDTVAVRTLADVIAFNRANAARVMPWFAQELLERAEGTPGVEAPAYREALATCRRLAGTEGVEALLAAERLDAVVAPSNGPSWPTDLVNGDRYTGGNSSVAAVAGVPSLTVPMGEVAGLPVGLSFIGRAWSEGRLLALGYAFEQATRARRAPALAPTLAAVAGGAPVGAAAAERGAR